MNNISPEQKAMKFLQKKRWYFEDEKIACKELKKAFKDSRHLMDSINKLQKFTDWGFYSIRDLINLDQARRIYLKYE